MQECFNLFQDPPTASLEVIASPEVIAREIITNLTAPTILLQHVAPHLLKLAQAGGGATKTNLFITTSTLAYIPMSFYPTYRPALTRVLRQQLGFMPGGASKNMAIVEIVPPYTDTGLDKNHREATIAMQGGPDEAFPPTPLGEYVEHFFQALEQAVRPDGSVQEEIGVGLGAVGVEA